jgi:hypothetical protein
MPSSRSSSSAQVVAQRLGTLQRQLAPSGCLAGLHGSNENQNAFGRLLPTESRAVLLASPTVGGMRHSPELHGLSEAERYAFEVNGYLVLEDMLSKEQLGEMNAAFDAVGDEIIKLRPRDEAGTLSRGAPALVGEHGRGDTGELMQWPEPWCQPFRELLSHPRTVRILLDLVGEGFHYSSANAITMDTGAEGHRMHGGGGGKREAWTYNCDRNGEITCNLITVMYQLADIGPGDGGLVCIRAWPRSPPCLSDRRARRVCLRDDCLIYACSWEP